VDDLEVGAMAGSVQVERWSRAAPLFRFVQARAPGLPTDAGDPVLPRVRTWSAERPTALDRALTVLNGDGDATGMVAAAERFLSASDREEWGGAPVRRTAADLPGWLSSFDRDVAAAGGSVDDLEEAVLAALRADEAFYSDERYRFKTFPGALSTEARALGDATIAASLWPDVPAGCQALLPRALRLVALLTEVVETGWRPPATTQTRPKPPLRSVYRAERVPLLLRDALILLPNHLFPLPGPAATSEPDERRTAPGRADAPSAPALRERLAAGAGAVSRAMAQQERSSIPTVETLATSLGQEILVLLQEAGISVTLPAPAAVDALDARLDAAPPAVLPAAESSASAALRAIGAAWPATRATTGFGDWSLQNLTRFPVVGDLLVVQQELLRYEAGEIAHIENVLPGERKVRTHTFTELREEEVTQTSEREEERTHDNQTTERQELEREASRESQTRARLDSGATFSGQFGAVQVGAHADFSYETSVQESNRTASRYAKEVVDRSVERVKERTLRTRRTLTRQRSRDRDRHVLDNGTAKDVVGIYQWVDRVYEAATFNYGRRMMLDVTVPEPAAYWRYATALGAVRGVDAEPPPALNLTPPGGTSRALLASDIGVMVTLDQLAATYRVGGLKPPPPRWVSAGAALRNETAPPDDKRGKDVQSLGSKSVDVKIPKGYVPRYCTTTVTITINPNETDWLSGIAAKYQKATGRALQSSDRLIWDHEVVGQNTIAVGPVVDVITPGTKATFTHTFVGPQVPLGPTAQVGEEGTLPVVLSVIGSPTYAATVTVVAERTDEAFRAWQLEQYEAVVQQWESWNAEFQAAVREAKRRADVAAVPSSGVMNPALGDAAVTTEMQRLFLQMLGVPLVGSGAGTVAADLSDPDDPTPPGLVPQQAAAAGRLVQFAEQAFEWPQLTYRLYPYYWRREADWPAAMQLDHPDPAFADFLRAGGARVVVPVRPGFEAGVCHHLGVRPQLPWKAGSPPVVDLDPYLSIAEEIKAAETTLTKPVRVDEPWLVRLPTTLVRLKGDGDLPVFRAPTKVTPEPTPEPTP
jgi:hypothetical protein